MGNLYDLATALGTQLNALGRTLATAESCTGGLIASTLTDVSGSSRYFMGGIVAYDNAIKQALLGVQAQTLDTVGAVSAAVAEQMAQGAQKALSVDYTLSVTGIAGPGGGTPQKPVGLTYIGLAVPDDAVIVQEHIWSYDRAENKQASVRAALQLLLNHLKTKEEVL